VSVILDVAIGLVFLYLLLALVATTVQELLASVLKLRAKNLYNALEGMLKGTIKMGAKEKPLIEAFYEHPLIKNLCKTAPKLANGKLVSADGLPSYIPSKTFVLAVLDVLRGDAALSEAVGARDVLLKAEGTLENIVGNDDLKRTLTLLLTDVEAEAGKLDEAAARVGARVEALFNDRMARASGWYKRQAQWVALLIAVVIAGVTNADTIHVADRLWTDPALRDSIVASAQAHHDAHAAAAQPGEPAVPGGVAKAAEDVDEKVEKLEAAGFPIGWPRDKDGPCLPLMVVGWIVTALAVSLGSNFWFDVLSKALQIRGGGPKVSAVTGRVGEE